MIVTASIYVGNMSKRKQVALLDLNASDLAHVTGFRAAQGVRDDCLVNWDVTVDETSPSYAGEAFVREDFVAALLDVIEEVA